jgi:2-amino-4-hydroxy-6-hydroxymethyldihydropteridine diphosphokinase
MVPVFLLLGSNLGNPLSNLTEARQHISRQAGKIITQSSVYKTAAWGNTDQPDFYNQALEIQAYKTPQETLDTVLDIEKAMGRTRKTQWGSRLIDIDILLWDNEIIDRPTLSVPHPHLHHRRFVLIPLAEIAPEIIHPTLRKSITQLLLQCTDNLAVEKLRL